MTPETEADIQRKRIEDQLRHRADRAVQIFCALVQSPMVTDAETGILVRNSVTIAREIEKLCT